MIKNVKYFVVATNGSSPSITKSAVRAPPQLPKALILSRTVRTHGNFVLHAVRADQQTDTVDTKALEVRTHMSYGLTPALTRNGGHVIVVAVFVDFRSSPL